MVPGSSNHVKIPIKCYPDVLKPETFEMWEGTVGAWQQGDMVRAFGGERDRSWFRKAASQSSETKKPIKLLECGAVTLAGPSVATSFQVKLLAVHIVNKA